MEQTRFVHTKGFTYFIGLSKALVKAGKEKECEKINKWRKACIRHFIGLLRHLGSTGRCKICKVRVLSIPCCE
jgi:hypothetical protein